MMWKDTYLENRVMGSDPMDLIVMLYDCAVRTIRDARGHLAAGDIELRTKAIGKVISIISELHGSLDYQAGGPLAENLSALYDYIKHRLTMANLKQEDAPLAEVESLLKTLAEGFTAAAQSLQPGETNVSGANMPPIWTVPVANEAEIAAPGVGWSA